MLRRNLMRLIGGAAAAPAVARAAERADMVEGRVPLPGSTPPMLWSGGEAPREAVRSGVMTMAEKALRRSHYEQQTRINVRRHAWTMALDPDLAAMTSCSEVFLRHLQEKRLMAERQADDRSSWSAWGLPDWMQD